MSEYQYYEFQAVERPLDRAAQEELRSISSRARITATSFTNEYNWGDLRGDPRRFMERWFDLHLYLANWGSRRLMLRVPKRFLDGADIEPFLREADGVEVWTSGDELIVDICRDEEPSGYEWDEGSGWLAGLAPLRADLLSGDLRLFYLVWLQAVEDELIADDVIEPLPGIAPLSGALESFAGFFGIDPDLVSAAGEQGAADAVPSEEELREMLAAIPEREKVELLLRVVAGDVHVATELRNLSRRQGPAPALRRTAGALRRRAQELEAARERAGAERREAERRRQAKEAAAAQRARVAILKRRGAAVWREVEEEIGRRNPSGYDRATSLLVDLQALAVEQGNEAEFRDRLAAICVRHENKRRFIERLEALGRGGEAML